MVGPADSLRVRSFCEAVKGIEMPDSVVVDYRDLVSKEDALSSVITSGTIVRIESPGKDFEVEKLLLSLGAEGPEQDVSKLVFDKGRIWRQTQWYRGWCRILGMIEEQLKLSAPHVVMNSPAEIGLLFDKPRCHEKLVSHGVKTTRMLGPISSFDELRLLMSETGCNRVFVKPAHSSSASGIVAIQFNGRDYLAQSTVEMVDDGSEVKLYNSRKVRVYKDIRDLERLINALTPHNLFVERWFPKAGIKGKRFDLRVLVIAGQAKHLVVRESRNPFTNLHLLNSRGDVDAVREVVGKVVFETLIADCEKTMELFPDSLYAGIDVMISSDFKTHAIAEINAFGDLLPGVLCDGLTTYEAELDAISQHPYMTKWVFVNEGFAFTSKD